MARQTTSLATDVKNLLVPVFQVFLRSKTFWVLLLLGLGVFFGYRYFTKTSQTTTLEYNSDLIQEKIKNVGKLVVTEGHFAQVMTYKDQQKYLMDLLSFEKKALIIINADVTIAYDLRQMEYEIDERNKIITLVKIPKEEIKISPDIKFYDVEQSTMNPFTGDDYNKINKKVKADLAAKIEKSKLKANAKNRLVSELAKVLILTNSMGWKLQYNNQIIETESQMGKTIPM